MNRTSQLDLFQSFIEREQQRSKIQLNGEMQAIFDYCEYIIHTQYDKKTKTKYKFKQRKKEVSQDFMRAYSTLQKQDKITYYIKNVIYLLRVTTGNMKIPKIREGNMETSAFTRSYNIRIWKLKKIRLDNSRQVMFGEKDGVIKEYDLGNYIFRGSKNNKYYTFVLEAINNTVNIKAKTVHIGFQAVEVMKQWAEAVQLCIDYRHWKRLYVQVYKKAPPKEVESPMSKNKSPEQSPPVMMLQKSLEISAIPKKSEQAQQSSFTITLTKQQQTQKNSQQKVERKKSSSSSQNFASDSDTAHKFEQLEQIDELERTIIEDLVEGEAPGIDNMESIENRNNNEKKNMKIKNLNIFHKMFPEFEFNEVEIDANYEMILNEKTFWILQHNQEKQRFKVFMELEQKQTPAQNIFKALCSLDFQKSYNQNIQQSQVKTFISSQNAAILYLVLKPFNRIYRPRDFVFIRHTFKVGSNAYYIADKDIENSHFPPFITIVRGKYQFIWTVLRKQDGRVRLIGNIYIDNSGYLSDMQNTNLTLNYLKHFGKIGDFVRGNKEKLENFSMFDANWDITMNVDNEKDNEARIKAKSQAIKQRKQKQQIPKSQSPVKTIPNLLRQTFGQLPPDLTQSTNQSPVLYPPLPPAPTLSPRTKMSKKQQQLDLERQKMNSEQVQGEIDPKNIKLETSSNVKLQFDKNGMVIISNKFARNKYPLFPVKDYPKLEMESPVPGKHPLWTDDWRHDTKKGGLLFINAKKMEDQKGVLKFILSKIGKNLLSGKSILNISLPVDIFVAKSNLQLFIQSLCYAPILLQKSVSLTPFQKFKNSLAFGISMSPLYLIMQKPFNPILGQTFQAWINGCPAYAQQISHHPPICSLLLYGRGYTISGQFQSKAEVHMNSGTGTNQGIFRIDFADGGEKVRFCSAGGEVSGLTYGDRKFNIQGKAYCWSEPSNYFVQIVFNPTKKGFFSMKKQQQPEDYYQGQTLKVTPQFISSLYTKRRAPTQKEIIQNLGKFNGVWHQQMLYEQQSLLNIGKQLPYKLQYEKYPLPSDSNWREDIAYRRLMEVPRAQVEKERLENLQRGDRKLRANHK